MGSVSTRDPFAEKGMEIFDRMRGERSSVFDGKSLSAVKRCHGVSVPDGRIG